MLKYKHIPKQDETVHSAPKRGALIGEDPDVACFQFAVHKDLSNNLRVKAAVVRWTGQAALRQSTCYVGVG